MIPQISVIIVSTVVVVAVIETKYLTLVAQADLEFAALVLAFQS